MRRRPSGQPASSELTVEELILTRDWVRLRTLQVLAEQLPVVPAGSVSASGATSGADAPMEFVERMSEDHMVAAFVRAEIDSARFGPAYRDALRQLGVGRGGVVDRPDLANGQANTRRRFLLREVRGYGANTALFTGWPADIEWWRVRVSIDELGTFKFAHYATWLTLSKGTRLVSDGAANVDSVPAPENTNANIKAVTARVRSGDRFPELILLARQRERPIVLLEGHTRATAYVIAGAPDPVDCFLGLSPTMNSWFYWGQP